MNNLIVLEGIDGVGKTSLARMLVGHLNDAHIPTVFYEDHPLRSALFAPLKQEVVRNASVETRFYFYLASTIHKSSIIERLLADTMVVLDRYIFSVMAHHLACGMLEKYMPSIDSLPIIQPHYTFHVTVQEGIRLKRVLGRGQANAQDLERAEGDTLAGRKLSFFHRVIENTIDNSQDGRAVALAQMLCVLR